MADRDAAEVLQEVRTHLYKILNEGESLDDKTHEHAKDAFMAVGDLLEEESGSDEAQDAEPRTDKPPEIYAVLPLPDAARGKECSMLAGNPGKIETCGNEATHVYVHEKNAAADDDRRGNSLVCPECKPEVTVR